MRTCILVLLLACISGEADAQRTYVWRNVEPYCVPRVRVEYNPSGEGIAPSVDAELLAARWNATNFYFTNSATNESGVTYINWDPRGFDQLASAFAVGMIAPVSGTTILWADVNSDGILEEFTTPETHMSIYLRTVSGMPWEARDSDCDNNKINLNWVLLHELGHAMLAWPRSSDHADYPAVMYAPSTQAAAMQYDCRTSIHTNDAAKRNDRYTATGYCQLPWAKGTTECLCYVDNPAADLLDIAFSDGGSRWKWRAGLEERTRGYLIQEQGADRSWQTVRWVERSGDGSYDIRIPDGKSQACRLVDVSISDQKVVLWQGVSHAAARDIDALPSASVADYAAENASAYLAARKLIESRRKDQEPTATEAVRVLLLYPAIDDYWGMRAHYLATFYELYTYASVTAVGYSVSSQAGANDLLRRTIKQLIAERYPSEKYVHLIGDANDWQEFANDGPRMPALWTPGAWADVRAGYIQNLQWYAAGQREKNMLPTWMESDPGEPLATMAGRYPYYASDLPYADVNNDGYADAFVARWPVRTLAQFDVMINKFFRYNQQPLGDGSYSVLAYAGDLEYVVGSGDGERAAMLVDAELARLPVGQNIKRVNESELLGSKVVYPYLASSIAAWNGHRPDLVLILSSASTRYSAGKFFDIDDGWVSKFHLRNDLSIVLGVTCDAANFATTERSDTPGGTTPVCERFLQESAGGAIAWVGPTTGSWQHGNATITRYIMQEMYGNPNRPMAQSVHTALRRVQMDFPADVGLQRLVRSYVYLGDPVSPFRRRLKPCSASVTSFVATPDLERCPLTWLRWQTTEATSCKIELRETVGEFHEIGRTEYGSSHELPYIADIGSTYYVRITPLCDGGVVSSAKWTMAVCPNEVNAGRGPVATIRPNPFNPSVRISYELPEPQDLTVEVYDLRGRLVEELVHGLAAAGRHIIEWQGRDHVGRPLPSGVYFLRFRGSEWSRVQKMVLLK